MNGLRRGVQIAVVASLVGVAALNLYAAAAVKYDGETVIAASPLLRVIDQGLGAHAATVATAVRGNLWTAEVLGWPISDPLAVLSVAATLSGMEWAFLLSAVLPIFATLLLGRVFCGWICPMGLVGEAVSALRRWLERVGLGTLSFEVPGVIRYVVLAAGTAVTAVVGMQVFALIYPPALISTEIHSALAGLAPGVGLGWLGGIVLAELLFGDRIWCRSLCPGGAVFSVLGRHRRVRVQKAVDRCTACGSCDRRCPHGLLPQGGALGGECDNCGICVSACPTRALGYHTTRRALPLGVALGVAVALLLGARIASAHHIRGVPHYAYQDAYPHAPTFEASQEAGRWTLRFSYFEIPGAQSIDLAVYITRPGPKGGDRVPYDAPVTFHVHAAHESPDVTHPFTTKPRLTHVHRVNWVYEQEGLYHLRVSFNDGAEILTAQFPMQMGQPPVRWGIMAVGAGLIAALFAFVVIARRRIDRAHQKGRSRPSCAADGAAGLGPVDTDVARGVDRPTPRSEP